MKLRIRRSGRHSAERAAEADNDFLESGHALLRPLDEQPRITFRCQGVTYRGKPCTLDAGPDGYCVFHKPKP